MSETRQDPPEADPADRRHGRAPRSPGRQHAGPAHRRAGDPAPDEAREPAAGEAPDDLRDDDARPSRDRPRPPVVIPPTPPYGTPTGRPMIPPTPPYGTPVPGAPDYGRSGPTYGPGHRDGWGARPTEPADDALAYPPGPRRGGLPTGVKLLIGAVLVVAALLVLGMVLGRLTDLPAGPFTDTVGRTSAQDAAPDAPAGAGADRSTIGADEWAAIARDPAAHRGERIRVAGRVTRLWSAGDGTARATVGGSLPSGARRAVTPVALTGSAAAFRTFRVHDEVLLRAVVEGDNAAGLPVLRVETSSVLQTG